MIHFYEGNGRVQQGTFYPGKAVCVVNNKFIGQMYVLVYDIDS